MQVNPLSLGIEEAMKLTLGHLDPVGVETLSLFDAVDRVAARTLSSTVDSPSVNASLKDGYAVLSKDVMPASRDHPVRLKVIGVTAAGGEDQAVCVLPGTAVRILTGARVPANADAVLSEEFTKRCGDRIEAFNDASTGRNVLRKGTDVRMGQQVVERGEVLTPGQVGLLAAAGHSKLQVYRNPSVTIIATGDEVVIPGRPLPEGKLYASNLATLGAWCKRYCLESRFRVVGDDAAELAAALERAVNETDTVITSGGAWTGDRDLVMDVLEQLGWEQVFHRVRIGPGKAVGFGLLRHRPVFTLPGGPPSNLMSFLQIVLPGLLKQSGRSEPFLPTRPVCMAAEVRGRSSDWTQYLFGRVEPQHATVLFRPLRGPSRLQDMAAAQAVVAIPEGRTVIPAGETVTAQWLL